MLGAGSGGASRLRTAGKSYGLDATTEQNAILGPISITGFNQEKQSNFRISVGPVFRFGKR